MYRVVTVGKSKEIAKEMISQEILQGMQEWKLCWTPYSLESSRMGQMNFSSVLMNSIGLFKSGSVRPGVGLTIKL